MASTTFTLDSRTAARRPPVVPRISSAGAGALVALLLALATGGPAAAQDNAQDLVKIGVLAKRGPERCLEKWGLTAEYLSKPIPVVPLDIGRSFVIVPLDYDELHAAVERGEVDFVLANPSMYVELETDHGVNRLVSLRNLHGGIAYTSYAGVIFRRADRDDIKCLDDLKGKTFMAVNEESLGGWLAAWRELKEAGIDPYRDFAELQFDDTHDFVVYTVRDGLVDAGTVRSDTLERMAAEGKIRLENFRVINEQGTDILELPVQRSTRRYPEWPLAKVAHTSDELAEEVAFALLNMPADCPAAKAARCAGWTVPLNYQPVHECLKELRVGLYKDYGKVTFGDVLKQYWPWIASVAVLLAGMAVTLAWALRFLRQRKRAEAILRESEQHHRQIFEAATDGVLVFDPRGKIVEANPAACAMYGYDYDELIGLGDRDIVHRNCYHLFENFKTQLQSAGKFHAESTDVRKDGTPFEVEVRGSPVAVKGKPHLLAVVSDITERKRAEEKLRLLSQAVGNAVEGIAMGDPEYRITYVNDTFTRMFGYSREELIGRNIADVYAKAQAPQLEEALKATMEGGWMGELVGKRKNGELFPVSISSSKVLNDEGNVVAQMASHSDITERKQVEEALAQAHGTVAQEAHKLRAMIEGMDEGIVVADGDDIITEVNEWFLDKVGMNRDDIVGKSLWEFHPDTEGTARVRAALGAFRGGKSRQTHIVNRELLGMQLSLRVQPILEGAHYRGVILNVINVTDLVEARRTAEVADRAKGEFLANMSHEIRTPMTAILGFTDVLLEHGDLENAPPDRVEAAQTIKRNGEYLLGIINDILDLSKIEAGKMTVERIACSPCRLVAGVTSLARVLADAKGLPLKFEYAGAIPETIQSDPTRLRQILINLIGNAIKFAEAGEVRLVTRFVEGPGVQGWHGRVGREGGPDNTADTAVAPDEIPTPQSEIANPQSVGPFLQFDVVDTGPGMSEEQVARVFRPFTQADNSTTREFGGTGLGLSISKRLAEMLGGDITVESKPGEGSTFRVRVATGPLAGVKMIEDPLSATVLDPEGAAGFSPRGAAQAEARGSSKLDCRILLAEDGLDNQRLIAHVLKKAGAEVTVKENGKLAADAALAARDAGRPFDVILMDMQMPVMDGYEATGLLRQKGYDGPIIALTAHAMASDRQKCIDAGCDDYANKPINRRKLIETIQEWLSASPRLCPAASE